MKKKIIFIVQLIGYKSGEKRVQKVFSDTIEGCMEKISDLRAENHLYYINLYTEEGVLFDHVRPLKMDLDLILVKNGFLKQETVDCFWMEDPRSRRIMEEMASTVKRLRMGETVLLEQETPERVSE
jgi:hypothetical protein